MYNTHPNFWLRFGKKKKVENKEKWIHKPNVNSIKTHLFHEILYFPEGNRCPAGIRYFSSFAISRAFNHKSDGRIARPLAFLPRFARLSRGIFSKFSLLFHHNLTLLSETPNSLSASLFPCCSAKLMTFILRLCSGEFNSHDDVVTSIESDCFVDRIVRLSSYFSIKNHWYRAKFSLCLYAN